MSQPLIMSFRPDAAQMCLDGRKTETRRLAKRHDFIRVKMVNGRAIKELVNVVWDGKICQHRGKVVYRVGDIISILPGRGKRAVGKVRCTDIEHEPLLCITDKDVTREGVEPATRKEYLRVWQKLHPRGPDNPMVRVIQFEPIDESEA